MNGAAGQVGSVYAVLDPARDARLFSALRTWAPDARCLFEGPLHPAIERAAPFVMSLTPGNPLLAWWRDEGLGQAWGILLRTCVDLAKLRRHLRSLLRVQLPGGQVVLFRFWDPRVLRLYLPTCEAVVLPRLFGPITHIYVESEQNRSVLTYVLHDGAPRIT